MSKHEAQQQAVEAEPAPDHVRAPRAGGGDELKSKPFAQSALATIDRVLGGAGSFDQLPELFSVLPDEERAKFLKKRMGELAVVPGAMAIEIAQLLKATPPQVIAAALAGQPAADAKALRAYLVTLTGAELATIDGDAFTKLKKIFGGALLTAIPTISEQLTDLAEHAGFMRWLIETTDSGVAAQLIVRHGSVSMGMTIDKLKLWTEWVDRIRPPFDDVRLSGLANVASDGAVKTKLLGQVNKQLAAGGADAEKYRKDHAGDVHAELTSKPSLKGLLDAVHRAGAIDGKDNDRLFEELHRLGATADDILAVSDSSGVANAPAFRALLAAPGVTGDHVTTFLLRSALAINLLTDDKARASVRKIAPNFRLQDVLATIARDVFHENLADPKHDGIRNWFLDAASPSDLLWFATHAPNVAARTTRLVSSRVGLDWVRKLTSAETEKNLRVLALNMPDASIEKFIRDVLLGDPPPDKDAPKVAIKGAREVDPRVFGGENERLDDAFNNVVEDELIARLGDVDQTRRVQLGHDIGTVLTIAHRIRPDQWARAAHLLDLKFSWTVRASPGVSSATVAYLHGRPKAEELLTLDDPDLVTKAAKQVHSNLLLVFPSLAEPKRLAKALEQNHDLLELLLAGSDPNLITNLISRDEVVTIATEIIGKNDKLLAKLPRFKHMTARGKEGVEKLRGATEETSIERAALDDVKDGNATIDKDAKRQGDTLHEVEEKKTLVEKIEALSGKHTKRIDKLQHDDSKHTPTKKDQVEENRESSVNALALIDMHRAELPDLLTDRTKRATVDLLHKMLDLPPDVAVPWIAATELVRMPNALRWWLTFRDPMAIMPALVGNQLARGLVGAGLETNTGGAREWLARVHGGPALDDSEARMLDQMRLQLKDGDALRALFLARFAFPAPDDFNGDGVAQLYAVLCRLPKGHVTQERIKGVTHHDIGGSTAGQWGSYSKQIEIDDNVKPGGKATDTFYDPKSQDWLPKDAFKKRYGFDDVKFQQLMHDDRIDLMFQVANDHGDFVYRLKEQKVNLFTQVVLHEVGHAVDEILGKRTQPVYGFGGWKEYDIDGGFDAWASELGGWDLVTANDRKQIKEVFKDAMRAETAVKDLVPADHPALDGKYAKVGLVAQLRAGKTFANTERLKHGNRVFSANPYYSTLYSLDASAAAVAPSDYSLYAPAEYFAESYVEYYRGVDGSPGSNTKKGGALAAPVKTWFDQNVDKVRFNPQRFDSGYDRNVDEQAKKPTS